ncbi:granzyme B(G,H)-like [Mugil cephalus]|uniref:granzyme B(G,H)-like n=1 Tax=Mugil cephalus TaxID=48193 RepID=UPI001FB77988|nr:granzyme B(G,H)-like [Mugil cephalus]
MPALYSLLLFCILTCLGQNVHGSEIIEGRKVPDELMTYMASVQNNKGHVCGGFLIRQDFVVTAAHCYKRDLTSVVLGTHNLKKVNNGKMRYNVTQACKHPDFKNALYGDDIMLLKLSQKAPLGKRITTIRLPKAGMKLKDNAKCHVAGWGFVKTGGKYVDALQSVDVTVVNLKECQQQWKQVDTNLPHNITCAGGYKTNKGFCGGDSGGPLVCDGVAVGVVSFNHKKDCDYPNKPNIYTDVSKYLPLINNILRHKGCTTWDSTA